MKDLQSTAHFDKFWLYFKDDFFDHGDILESTGYNMKIIRTYRITWWRNILLKLGFNIKCNSRDQIIYKVKLLK